MSLPLGKVDCIARSNVSIVLSGTKFSPAQGLLSIAGTFLAALETWWMWTRVKAFCSYWESYWYTSIMVTDPSRGYHQGLERRGILVVVRLVVMSTIPWSTRFGIQVSTLAK